jgi:hypothetical protein
MMGDCSAVAKVVLEHWLPFFYMAQNICKCKMEKTNLYIHKIASKLIDLMSSKATSSQKSPTHYISLKWIVAFGEYMFDALFEWSKRHDPCFGPESYGHISRLVPEHLFIMENAP